MARYSATSNRLSPSNKQKLRNPGGFKMKRSYAFLLAVLLLFFFAGAVNACEKYSIFHDHNCILDDVSIDIDDGSVILINRDRDGDEVEITEDYKLYINGRQIKTTEEQKELLAEYHKLVLEITDCSKKIGLEGAKIGIRGARLGLKAIACVFKLLRSDYDSDDLEREIEAEADKLEAKAEKLEIKAEKIEEMAEDLEDLHEDLIGEIPELAELDWY
jgi:Skp family chaperone for outer membrane proteins